jgi:hypothetical protein
MNSQPPHILTISWGRSGGRGGVIGRRTVSACGSGVVSGAINDSTRVVFAGLVTFVVCTDGTHSLAGNQEHQNVGGHADDELSGPGVVVDLGGSGSSVTEEDISTGSAGDELGYGGGRVELGGS